MWPGRSTHPNTTQAMRLKTAQLPLLQVLLPWQTLAQSCTTQKPPHDTTSCLIYKFFGMHRGKAGQCNSHAA